MAVHHVIARGLQALKDGPNGPGDEDQVSPWALLIIPLTMLFFFVLLFSIAYTYGEVLPILCMIESPETSAYVPVQNISTDEPPAYTEDEDDGVSRPTEDEAGLVRNKPYTSSIRATINHLRARAGYRSRFRGFWIFFVIGILRSILIGMFTLGSSNIILVAGAAIIAEVLLANLYMTWVHIIISDPSPKKWWQRLPRPALTAWRRIAPAVALHAVAMQFMYILPMLVVGIRSSRFADPDFAPGRKEIYLTATQMTGALILMIILFLGLQIPAIVTMVRVAASMLPEEDETIVPFDRTYGGKVTPAIIGGEGKIDLVEAWRSFPWASRKRLLVLMLKVTGIITAVWLAYVFVVVAEIHVLMTPEAFQHIMKSMHGH